MQFVKGQSGNMKARPNKFVQEAMKEGDPWHMSYILKLCFQLQKKLLIIIK